MTTPENLKINAQKINEQAPNIRGFFPNQQTIYPKNPENIDKILDDFHPDELEYEIDWFSEAEEYFTSYLERMGLACWIEVITQSPKCIYYFGPFASGSEAQRSVRGYLEDLQAENAKIVSLEIKRGIPRSLTIFEEEMEHYFVNSEFSSFVPAWFGV
ncbi:DUF1816 domain-containing protein [Capilliphycus salinus ALCB114379]|uniref:DUF1816 domain-containing protein n=1 Tax=Capilliphycus salinus TaxID=2768948 RepID=UPI0039A4A597